MFYGLFQILYLYFQIFRLLQSPTMAAGRGGFLRKAKEEGIEETCRLIQTEQKVANMHASYEKVTNKTLGDMEEAERSKIEDEMSKKFLRKWVFTKFVPIFTSKHRMKTNIFN